MYKLQLKKNSEKGPEIPGQYKFIILTGDQKTGSWKNIDSIFFPKKTISYQLWKQACLQWSAWSLCDGFGLAPSPLLSWVANCESNHEVQRVLFLLTFHFMLPILDSSKTAFQKFHLFSVTSEVKVHISVHIRDARLLWKDNTELMHWTTQS